jgi:para-aminobenzoate synthetase/4-amino-4-deoxychorismate lyase
VLAGTYRGCLLEKGEIREARLEANDLARATRVWLINSVRGRLEATVQESPKLTKP